ncbi:MAG: mechanosensitive ion channel family protein [Rhodospirillales bacterium]|nr:mechanosensitive ion channel family protein [Rhodospirillales bacterium]
MEQNITKAVDKAVFEAVNQQLLVQGGVTTIVIIVAFLILRSLLVHFLKGKTEILDKEQRRWINRVNNGTTIAIALGLILIWAPQLHTFALSLTAVAVAIVLTTKELLMCLTGGFLRASNKTFDIGDWITISGVTGEVMRISAMTTLLEEIDVTGKNYQYTGKTIQIPNSKFLTEHVQNGNFTKSHIYHDVPVTVQYADLSPQILMNELKAITEKHFADYHDAAIKLNKRVERKAGVDFPDPEPQFFLKTTDIGHNTFTVRLFIPTIKANQIGADITLDFLAFVHVQKEKKVSSEPKS